MIYYLLEGTKVRLVLFRKVTTLLSWVEMDEVIVSVWFPNTCNPPQEQIKRNWPVHCSSWRDMCQQETYANHQLSCIVSVSHPGVKCCQTHPPVFPWTALSSNGGLGGLRPDQGEECEVRLSSTTDPSQAWRSCSKLESWPATIGATRGRRRSAWAEEIPFKTEIW